MSQIHREPAKLELRATRHRTPVIVLSDGKLPIFSGGNMNRFLPLIVTLFSVSAIASEAPSSAPAEAPEMRVLFNGKDLMGWDGDPRLWSVKDGVIHGETTEENPAKGNTFLICTQGSSSDFELRLSFRCSATNNSGIQYRSRHIKDLDSKNAWVVKGYQHELRNENKLPNVSGFIYDEGGKRSRICLVGEETFWGQGGKYVIKTDLIDEPSFQKIFKLDDWNDIVIIARGHHILHYLNDRLVLDFKDYDSERALTEGILALQLHAGKPMWAEFKNIRIREIH